MILVSGGMDSALTLAIARGQGFDCHALSISYGQRNQAEITAAATICAALRVKQHQTIHLDLGNIAQSALTDPAKPIPEQPTKGIPPTYVPARNTLFLALALAWAETLDCDDLFIGVNALDYSGYPDCRPEFIHRFQKLAGVATRRALQEAPPRVHAPLLYCSKVEIVQQGVALGIDFGSTVSCYQATPGGEACGRCDACRLRREGFSRAGVPDPTRYRNSATAKRDKLDSTKDELSTAT